MVLCRELSVVKVFQPVTCCISVTEELQEAERRREDGDTSAPTVRAQIPFTACMAALSEPEILTDFWSSAVQTKTTATKYEERQPHIPKGIY